MTAKVDDLRDKLGDLFRRESRAHKFARRFVSVGLIAGGAAAAGWAQFITPLGKGESNFPHILGYMGVIAAFVGAAWVFMVDEDKSEALETARKALDDVRDHEFRDLNHSLLIDELQNKQKRLSYLYQALQNMREGIEQAHQISPPSETDAVARVLEIGVSVIRSAIAFSMDEAWTISAYRADPGPEGAVLTCIAASRFDGRDAAKTRSWPVGVGHTGAAYARSAEIVVADLADPALGTLDQLPVPWAHGTDTERYRSIAAVPIRALNDGKPWGVVVASSDKPDRFTLDRDAPGSISAEVVRGLAGMLALAVTSQRGRSEAPAPSVQ